MSYIIASILIFIAVGLTVTMFITRNSMLGFPSGIFWAVACGYAYQQSSATWDMLYLIFFAAAGMVIFSIFAAFALRKQDLSGPDADKGLYIDEGGRRPRSSGGSRGANAQYRDDPGGADPEPSWGDIDHLDMHDLEDIPPERRARTSLHERAKRRKAKASWGEFK